MAYPEKFNNICRTWAGKEPDACVAAEAALQELKTDSTLWRQVSRTLAYNAVLEQIHRARHSANEACIKYSQAEYEPVEQNNTNVYIGQIARNGILKSYKVGKKSLGDCNKADLVESINKRKAEVKGIKVRMKFESAIAEMLSDNDIVSEVINDEDAERLLRGN
jgi:hypothetical protein